MYNPPLAALIIFAACWAVGIYLVNCLIARKVKRVNIKQALLHFLAMAMIGLIGEICVGTVYRHFTGETLWRYTVYPIHNAYTSQYALFLWGIYGFHLYLLHGTLRLKNIRSINHLAFLFCLEAVVIEAAVNITYKLSFGNYIYYYFPSDLWHLTSIQTLPFYLIAGYVIVKVFRRFELRPQLFGAMSMVVVTTLVLLK